MRFFSLSWIVTLLCTCLMGCGTRHSHRPETDYDLKQIQDSNLLTVLTLYSSTSFFNYRGQEMGWQYELSQQFAKSIGVKLKVKVARNVTELMKMLQTGQGDLIAYNLPVTKTHKDSVLFCGAAYITHQVLVQRTSRRKRCIKDVTELIGKEIFVKPGKYYDRLVNLNEELGGGIIIHQVTNDSITEEDLIRQVSHGDIDYTVAEYEVARLNATYYPHLNTHVAISFDQRTSWAVRKECTKLAEAANQWFKESQLSPAYSANMKRYFEQSKRIPHSPILSIKDGKISHYDTLFKRYAKQIGWDWKLLAALAYTESNFDTTAVSWAGAKGLMQLMPATAKAMGVPKGLEQNPEESIKAAVKYIELTSQSFMKVPKKERPSFVLAAYNSGIGHVQDAMALAHKYGRKQYIWRDNVEKFILLKSNEEFFTDPVCKNGYFRGIDTFNFVRDVLERHEQYRKYVK